MTGKQIATYLEPSEYADFQHIKRVFERKSNSDTIRAMLSFCKKNLQSSMPNSHTTCKGNSND